MGRLLLHEADSCSPRSLGHNRHHPTGPCFHILRLLSAVSQRRPARCHRPLNSLHTWLSLRAWSLLAGGTSGGTGGAEARQEVRRSHKKVRRARQKIRHVRRYGRHVRRYGDTSAGTGGTSGGMEGTRLIPLGGEFLARLPGAGW